MNVITQRRLGAAALLVAGAALAAGTPQYLVYIYPISAAQVAHITPLQVAPYALCAMLWLPWNSLFAARVALALAIALTIASLFLYVPQILNPRVATGSDMMGIGYFVVSVGSGVAVLLASVIILAWHLVTKKKRVVGSRPNNRWRGP